MKIAQRKNLKKKHKKLFIVRRGSSYLDITFSKNIHFTILLYIINLFNSDLDEFIPVTLQPSAIRQVWSEEAENFFLTSWHIYLLEVHGNFQSEDILFFNLEAGENGLITWFSKPNIRWRPVIPLQGNTK